MVEYQELHCNYVCPRCKAVSPKTVYTDGRNYYDDIEEAPRHTLSGFYCVKCADRGVHSTSTMRSVEECVSKNRIKTRW